MGDCLAPPVERVHSLVCEAQVFWLSFLAPLGFSSLLYTISLSFARARIHSCKMLLRGVHFTQKKMLLSEDADAD